ncbi:MAG: SGNH/GDSL hydrolase family protein, partial [Nitrospinaceae bacterium]
MNPTSSWIKSLLFPVSAVLLFFFLLEAVLRLSGYQPKIKFHSFELPYWFEEFDPAILEEFKKHVMELGFVNEDVYAYRPDDVLGYVLKPGIRKSVRNYSASLLVDKMPEWTLVSDESGFRTGESISSSGNARGTVHVLGDSSSFGWGVDYEQTYGYVLKERLNGRSGDGHYNLVNHSMPGFSSFQGRLLLERLDSIRPGDWVLVSFGWNDSYFSNETDRTQFEKRASVLARTRDFLNRFLFYKWQKAFWLGRVHIEESVSPDTGQRVPVQEYKENLKAIFGDIKSRGAKSVFLSICNFDEYPQAARSVSKNMSVPFIDFPEQAMALLDQVPTLFAQQFIAYFDIYGDLMEKEPSLMVLFPDYCHPNVIGHQLLGGFVFDSLKNEIG